MFPSTPTTNQTESGGVIFDQVNGNGSRQKMQRTPPGSSGHCLPSLIARPEAHNYRDQTQFLKRACSTYLDRDHSGSIN